MTEERKNEIWAMLPEDFKGVVRYCLERSDQFFCYEDMLDHLFGSHNLTAQAEEKPNKDFSSNAQNWVNPTENGISDSKIQSESAESVETNTNERLNDKSLPYGKRVVTPFGEGVIVMDIEGCKCVKLDAGGCAGIDKAVLISETENPIDYSQYRLDLAKEIAVAMINNPSGYGNIARIAVSTANEIVKRLKETEE